jgi:hypothetical protein
MVSLPAKIAFSFALLSSFVAAAPSGWYGRGERRDTTSVGKAVYFLTNEAENAVVALPIGKDGMLSEGTVTKTGGAGSNAINGETQEPLVPDPLISQSALTVVGTVS